VLATLDSLPVNSAIAFTAPDTGATGILVHEADGTIHAFSDQCTHRPYPVEYDPGNQQLVCPLHMACFNATSGRVTRGPARRTLPAMPVHVDDQGNILYG
jgi:nitrite reductase/ring-hydroxylating ferredoxin subunit